MPNVKLVPGLLALLRMARSRKSHIASAGTGVSMDAISDMAKRLHPEALKLVVTMVIDETDTVRTYRLKPADGINSGSTKSRETFGDDNLPMFQAGQYISVKLDIEGSYVSRAYTICSAPYEAEGADGYYEIAIRRKAGGFVSNAIWDTWKPGTAVDATGPHGEFYVSPLRDTNGIVAIAGGAGITPFISMMKQFARGETECSVTLLYGCKDKNDILFGREISEVIKAHPGRFKRADTFEDNTETPALRKGFIDAEFISANVEDPLDKTYFICGPPVMYGFLRKELCKLGNLERKQTRYEVSGAPDDVTAWPGFDASLTRPFNVNVVISGAEYNIPALPYEPLLVAIERAGLILDSRCRSGECGICRSKLKEGNVFILPDNDGRREADKQLGYIHPCCTYPQSDLTVVIPPGRAAQT